MPAIKPAKARKTIVDGFKAHPEYFEEKLHSHLLWLEKELQTSKDYLADVRSLLEKSKKECQTLRSELEDAKSFPAQYLQAEKTAAVKTARLEKDLYYARSDAASLAASNRDLTVRCQRLSEDNDRLKQQIQDQDKKIRRLERKLTAWKEYNSRSKEELKKENEALKTELAQKNAEILTVKADSLKIKEERECLERKYLRLLRGDSTNTGFPSSFDLGNSRTAGGKENRSAAAVEKEASKKRTPVSSRKASGQPRGGVKGHPVHRSSLSAHPDRIVTRHVSRIPSGAVEIRADSGVYYAVQEVSFALRPTVTEFRYVLDRCADRPEEKEMKRFKVNPVCYSTRVRSAICYLHIFGGLPLKRMSAILRDLSSGAIDIRESAMCSWLDEFCKKSEERRNEILDAILQDPVIHVDETGTKINGRLYWMHVITSKSGTWFTVTKSRGGKNEKGPVQILSESGCTGVVVHDHFKPYLGLDKAVHQECNVHIVRYLRNGVVFDGSKAAEKLIDLFEQTRHEKEELKKEGMTTIGEKRYEQIKAEILYWCENGCREWEEIESLDPDQLKKYRPPYYLAVKRIIRDIDNHLRFLADFSVPFGNNDAEREMLMAKMFKKISRQHITEKGARNHAAVLTIQQTARKTESNILSEIENVFMCP